MALQSLASRRDSPTITPRCVPRDHPTSPTPLPTLTLLTWDEYQAFNQETYAGDGGASEDPLPTAVFDENGGYTTDESDDEDFAADMNDDDMVPASLWKATCVPTFAVETQHRSDYAASPVLPSSMPSTSLETCINTPTFALVPTHSYKARTKVWRDPPASSVGLPNDSAPPGVEAPASSKLARSPSPTRIISQPAPTHHAPSQACLAPARVPSPKRKRQGKASSAEHVGAAAQSLSTAGKRAQAAKKQKHGTQHPRNPLQPKVPNAVAPEVMRSVTA